MNFTKRMSSYFFVITEGLPFPIAANPPNMDKALACSLTLVITYTNILSAEGMVILPAVHLLLESENPEQFEIHIPIPARARRTIKAILSLTKPVPSDIAANPNPPLTEAHFELYTSLILPL
jgi:hypothetical protein